MSEITIKNHWAGKKVAFLGDSITDADHIGTTCNYWEYLQEMLDIEPLVYGINGCQWSDMLSQSQKLFDEHIHDVDAIIVFMGTNDYSCGVPLGEWWQYQDREVNSRGQLDVRPCREADFNPDTFRGRINMNMAFLKEKFPRQQIILLTMLHRGFAEFGGSNIQPAECFPNDCNLYLDSYIKVIKEAGNIWSVPVIDLNALSGLYPMLDAYSDYFSNAQTDRLHPAAAGHKRIAETLKYQLLALPGSFR